MLSSVFMPMLQQMTGADLSGGSMVVAPAGSSSSSSFNSHRELLGNMQKFLSQVSNALQQLNGDVTLQVGANMLEMGM